jgi:hypothetical protein
MGDEHGRKASSTAAPAKSKNAKDETRRWVWDKTKA